MASRLPHHALAVVDIAKIADYCLNPSHPRGGHKARVLRDALGLTREDAGWLRAALLLAAQTSDAVPRTRDEWGEQLAARHANYATPADRDGKNRLDHSNRRVFPLVCLMLGAVMNSNVPTVDRHPTLLDVVALVTERLDLGLPRGAAGTVVGILDDSTSLVEFSEDAGRAQAIVACAHGGLRVVSGPRG